MKWWRARQALRHYCSSRCWRHVMALVVDCIQVSLYFSCTCISIKYTQSAEWVLMHVLSVGWLMVKSEMLRFLRSRCSHHTAVSSGLLVCQFLSCWRALLSAHHMFNSSVIQRNAAGGLLQIHGNWVNKSIVLRAYLVTQTQSIAVKL